MRTAMWTLLAGGVLCVTCGAVLAQDDPMAIIDKAIEAQGGEAAVAKMATMRVKVSCKGAVIPGQGEISFTLEDTWQMPGQYRTTTSLKLQGRQFTQTQVIDGDQCWANTNGQTMPLPPAGVLEIKEQKYAQDVGRLLVLKEDGYSLSVLPEVDIDGRPAVGVKVTSEGHRDVTLYFDSESGLLVKRQEPVQDQTGKTISQEVFFRDYEEKDGLKHFMKIIAHREGKKWVEGEVTELEFFDKLPDAVFAQP
jgi:hypothetical protein